MILVLKEIPLEMEILNIMEEYGGKQQYLFCYCFTKDPNLCPLSLDSTPPP